MFKTISNLLKKDMPIPNFYPFLADHFEGYLNANPDCDFMELRHSDFLKDFEDDEIILRNVVICDIDSALTDEKYNVIFKAESIRPLFGNDSNYKKWVDKSKEAIDDNCGFSVNTGGNFPKEAKALVDLYSPLLNAALYLVSVDDSIGVYDYNGKVIIKPQYYSITHLNISSELYKDYRDTLILCHYEEGLNDLIDVYDCNGNMLYKGISEIYPIEDEVLYGEDFMEESFKPLSRKIKRFAVVRNNDELGVFEKSIVESDHFYINYEDQGFPLPLCEANFKPEAVSLMGEINLNEIKDLLTTLADSYKGEYSYSKKELVLRIPLWETLKYIEYPFPCSVSLSTPITQLQLRNARLYTAMRRSKIATVEDIIESTDRIFDRIQWFNKETRDEFKLLKLKLQYWLK